MIIDRVKRTVSTRVPTLERSQGVESEIARHLGRVMVLDRANARAIDFDLEAAAGALGNGPRVSS